MNDEQTELRISLSEVVRIGGHVTTVRVDLREPHDNPEMLARLIGVSVDQAKDMLQDYQC